MAQALLAGYIEALTDLTKPAGQLSGAADTIDGSSALRKTTQKHGAGPEGSNRRTPCPRSASCPGLTISAHWKVTDWKSKEPNPPSHSDASSNVRPETVAKYLAAPRAAMRLT